MAFNSENFEYHTQFPVDAGTVYSPVVWKYETTDNLSEIGNHYFDGQGSSVRKFDWIAVTANDKNAWFRVTDAIQNPLGDLTVTVTKFTEVSVFSGQINI